jgi:hypothetical protein
MEIELSSTRQASGALICSILLLLRWQPNFSATRMQEGKFLQIPFFFCFCIFLVWNLNMNTKFFVLSYFESCFLEFCDIWVEIW